MRERIHRERARALGEHVEQLDECQREALWDALPVLEELVERLPDGRGGQGGRGAGVGQSGRR